MIQVPCFEKLNDIISGPEYNPVEAGAPLFRKEKNKKSLFFIKEAGIVRAIARAVQEPGLVFQRDIGPLHSGEP